MMTTPVTAVPYFEEAGSGSTTVLLLHGIGGGRQAFAGQMQPLAAAGFQVVAWDMPGYGHSSIVDPYTFETIAEECLELIDVLAPERLVLVGHSMGGMVAQEVVARAPGRVAALVLAGTTAAFGKADGPWQQDFIEQRTAPLDAGLSMHELAVELVASMMASGASASARGEAVAIMGHVPPPTYRLALRALMGFDRREQLKTLAMPALLIAGDEDRNAPPAVMRGMADRMADARFVSIPACGHLMNLERPEAFNQALIDFLRTIDPEP